MSLARPDINAVKKALEKTVRNFGNSLLPLDSIDFGERFKSHAAKNLVPRYALENVKQRCLDFLIVLCEQLVLRLPENLAVLSNLRFFTPAMCLSQSLIISADDLPWELSAEGADRDLIRIQWCQLRTLRLHDISIEFDNNVEITKFWIAVWNLRDASGNQSFKELASFAIRALSLPISNADVERVFSVISIVKTKLRNRMLLPMLVALIRIRIHMSVHGHCCKNYTPTEYMLQLFTSKIYESSEDSVQTSEISDGALIESLKLIEAGEIDL
ncbi:hypothetical protein KQX54_016681 [Cotesia glomerata]|uniref:HAT C-terminal dimerisation domain-containing protein n=1 Tax=Cotesia glomerata TaxID=32391 RepID=A0AAV7IML9_COTGL|nr:hypothetical protein KQX54_016681 [Cotesia glomerata]